ncbi:MAG: right-handed parallel beta-helix repeat-containing protein, partial [Sedimentisphaerales bacterium]|nr:right-handed parallel beta-helix repeat-containing protein [Sedimentisphaerales bacterium]
ELIVSASLGGSVSEPGAGAFAYDSATTVSIAAHAYSGYRFSRWTGTAVNAGKVADPAAASTTVTVDSSYELYATFTPLSSSALQVLAPNGGETLAAGSTFPIRWLVQGDAEIVSIELTVDEGSAWRHLGSFQAAVSSYDWPVPFVDSDRCLIRIAAEDSDALFDTSDACFSIRKPLGRIWYVDATAAGNGDGTRWDSAFIHLQDALAQGSATDEIHVAEGLYWPDLGGGRTPGDRKATFQLPDGVTIYGGFPRGGGASEQRDPFAHQSILSGDIGVAHVTSDNSYHVVTAAGAGRTSMLDGFLITAGFANGDGVDMDGAGIYNTNGGPVVRNCTFAANDAVGVGGAACNRSSNPAFINCVFSGNTAGASGGAVHSEQGEVTITNCTFTANHATWRAGGVFDRTGTTTLTNCILWGNSRLSKGRYDELSQVSGDSPLTISHCCIQNWTGSLSGDENIGQVPAFVDADGPDDVAGTRDDDVRLQAGSPCIDAGDNTAVWLETTTDLQGNPRIVHSIVDLGAYEYGEASTR